MKIVILSSLLLLLVVSSCSTKNLEQFRCSTIAETINSFRKKVDLDIRNDSFGNYVIENCKSINRFRYNYARLNDNHEVFVIQYDSKTLPYQLFTDEKYRILPINDSVISFISNSLDTNYTSGLVPKSFRQIQPSNLFSYLFLDTIDKNYVEVISMNQH